MEYRNHTIERDTETGCWDITSGRYWGQPWQFETLSMARRYIDLRNEGMPLHPKALADALGTEVVKINI